MRTQTWAYYALSVFTFANYATAQSPSGTWTLYPPQVTGYTTAVQPPINADGTSNFKSTGKAVIPVKFSLATAPGPVIFQSILSDTDASNDYLYLSFVPSRLRKKADFGVTRERIGSSMLYARRRPTAEWNVQLHFGGAASAGESSAETAAEDGG